MGVFILFIIIILCVSVLFFKIKNNFNDDSGKTVIEVRTLDIPDDNSNGLFETRIAGVNRYCTSSNVGAFHGIIFNESKNSYNHNAMIIYDQNAHKLGYVPESDLSSYVTWSEKKPFSCVGFIKYFDSEDGFKLFGKVTAIKPCNKSFVERKTKEIYDEIQKKEF